MLDHISTTFDSTDLLIVKSEIQNIIKRIESEINILLEDNTIPSEIEDSLHNLAQASQILYFLRLPYLAQLAQLITELAHKILNDFKENHIQDSDLQVMSESTNTIVYYIDFVCNKEKRVPQIVLPALNKLEAVLKKPLTQEGNFISEIISQQPQNLDLTAPQSLPSSQLAHRLYKITLLNLLQNKSNALDYQALSICGHYFALAAENKPSQSYWRMVDQALSNSKHIIFNEPRLATLSEIESLVTEFTAAPDQFQATATQVANVIMLILAHQNPLADQIHQKYSLPEFIIDDVQFKTLRKQLFGPDLNTIKTVVELLNHQLNEVNKQLEIGQYTTDEERQQIIAKLNEVAKILHVLNLNSAAEQLQQQVNELSNAKLDDLNNPQHANNLMDAILSASNALQILVHQHSPIRSKLALHNHNIILDIVENAQQTLCDEARASLQKVFANILSYKHTHDFLALEETPSLLRETSGALLFLESTTGYKTLQEAAKLLEQDIMTYNRQLEDHQIDLLAAAIISADYHLEQIQTHQPFMPKAMQAGWDNIQKLAQTLNA